MHGSITPRMVWMVLLAAGIGTLWWLSRSQQTPSAPATGTPGITSVLERHEVPAHGQGLGKAAGAVPEKSIPTPEERPSEKPSIQPVPPATDPFPPTPMDRYSAGLQTASVEALATRRGDLALELSGLIRLCMDGNGRRFAYDPALSARFTAWCQTLGANPKGLRLQLLKLAVEQEIQNAAVEYEQALGFEHLASNPKLWRQLAQLMVRDARQGGDLGNLGTIATMRPADLLGISEREAVVFWAAYFELSQSPWAPHHWLTQPGNRIRDFSLASSRQEALLQTPLNAEERAQVRQIVERVKSANTYLSRPKK